MATSTKPRYVDVSNPAMAVQCPRCGLTTPRFLQFCSNDGYQLWPSGPMASAAFGAWRDADPSRAQARRFDLAAPLPGAGEPLEVDYLARAHELGIHLFPNSRWPIVICAGFFFLSLAAVSFPNENLAVRIGLAVIGAICFFGGVAGWVVVEDVRLYPSDSAVDVHEEGVH